MTTTIIDLGEPEMYGKTSIRDDFSFASNVAQANIYVRLGFLRKVYGILCTQLLFTVIVASVTKFTPAVRSFISQNNWLLTLALFLSLGLFIALHIKRRETPTNFILLGIFTFVQAYSIGVVVTYYDDIVVLQALFLTTAVTLGLTLYTFQSKRDLSKLGGGLFAALCILILGGFIQMFIGSSFLEILLAAGGSLIFSLFIVYDTHMIMNRISAEEYILATIELYLDIINLFLELLRLLDAIRKH